MNEKMQKLINEISSQISAEEKRLSRLLVIIERYPNLKPYIDRWNRTMLFDQSINQIASDVEIYHSCGCCSDSPVIASPYIEVITEFGSEKIYSDPPQIYVGVKAYDEEMPNSNYNNDLKKYGIPDKVIRTIEIFFEKNKPDEEEDDE